MISQVSVNHSVMGAGISGPMSIPEMGVSGTRFLLGVGMSRGWVLTPRHGYSRQAGDAQPTGMLSYSTRYRYQFQFTEIQFSS